VQDDVQHRGIIAAMPGSAGAVGAPDGHTDVAGNAGQAQQARFGIVAVAGQAGTEPPLELLADRRGLGDGRRGQGQDQQGQGDQSAVEMESEAHGGSPGVQVSGSP